ncbi:hypothetical protein [Geobacillus sp. BK01]|uniref:hypothetical protein n=1 Tax=Geobacillus sp. BK01 TaxID=3457328 RepID=UPI0004279F53
MESAQAKPPKPLLSHRVGLSSAQALFLFRSPLPCICSIATLPQAVRLTAF